MKRKIFFAAAALMAMLTVNAYATEIDLPDLISDNMLIQQGETIKLWGTAGNGETVNIKLGTDDNIVSEGTAKAETDGEFSAELPATVAGGPYKLTFTTDTATAVVENVLVGELWVQSGQSNMARLTSEVGKHSAEILPEDTIDEIRLFINTEALSSDVREEDLAGRWTLATKKDVSSYSAVGFSALNKLYNELKIPVGGICNAIGGAGMDSFVGPAKAGEASKGDGTLKYYNAKTAPLTKLNVRGVMWYQGESDRWGTSKDFATKFKNFIASWRKDWQDDDMPFVFVSLPPSPMTYYASWSSSWLNDYDYSQVRLGQYDVYKSLDNVGIAISIDCPPEKGDDALHPNNKKPVGERLAMSALGMIYGIEGEWLSPMYKETKLLGNSATITFYNTYGGLKTKDGNPPKGFMVAGADGKFYEAEAEITGENTVLLKSNKVSRVQQIAYGLEKYLYPNVTPDTAFDTYINANLVNSADIAAAPFLTNASQRGTEKNPLYSVAKLTQTVEAGETYTLPEKVSVTKENGSQAEVDVIWAVDTVEGTGNKTINLCGLVKDKDIIIPAEITVNGAAEPEPIDPNDKSLKVTVNGVRVKFDQEPIIENNRTLVPFRYICNAMGATVEWNAAESKATATLNGITLEFVTNVPTVWVNGVAKSIDQPPVIRGGRTLLPARAFAEEFGAKVDWDAETRTVIITQ